MSAGMHFFNHDMVAETFSNLAYPTFIIYPLAIAKILGLLAIWTKKSNTLKEWAYAGFFFDFILALSAHLYVKDREFAPSPVATNLLIVSYLFEIKLVKKLYEKTTCKKIPTSKIGIVQLRC